MINFSTVKLVGAITAINLEKRDFTVVTATPRGKAVTVTVHMWKAPSDGDDPAWAGRDEWKDVYHVGDTIAVQGHLGNNERVIATGAQKIEINAMNDSDDDSDDFSA